MDWKTYKDRALLAVATAIAALLTLYACGDSTLQREWLSGEAGGVPPYAPPFAVTAMGEGYGYESGSSIKPTATHNYTLYFDSNTIVATAPKTDPLKKYDGYSEDCWDYKSLVKAVGLTAAGKIPALTDLTSLKLGSGRFGGAFLLAITEKTAAKMVAAPSCDTTIVASGDIVVPSGTYFTKVTPEMGLGAPENTWIAQVTIDKILTYNSISSQFLAAMGVAGTTANAWMIITPKSLISRYLIFDSSFIIVPNTPIENPAVEFTSPALDSIVQPLPNCLSHKVTVKGKVSHSYLPLNSFNMTLKVDQTGKTTQSAADSEGLFSGEVSLVNGVNTVLVYANNNEQALNSLALAVNAPGDLVVKGGALNGYARTQPVKEFGVVTPKGGRPGDNDVKEFLVGKFNQYPDAYEMLGTSAFTAGGLLGTRSKIRLQWLEEQASYASDVGIFLIDPKNPPKTIDDVVMKMTSDQLFILFNSGSYGDCCAQNVLTPQDGLTQFWAYVPAGAAFGVILFPNHTLAQAKKGYGTKPHTTIPWLNPGGVSQTLIYSSAQGRNIAGQGGAPEYVVCLDDQPIASGISDQDFSDVIVGLRLNPEPLPVFKDAVCAQFNDSDKAYIEGAAFVMGCDSSVDSNCFAEEKPLHTVTVSGFLMDKTEVTVSDYQKCVAAGICSSSYFYSFDANGMCNYGSGAADIGEYPMNCVNWYGAEAYCEWKGGRLPTEAEWEYAARRGGKNLYPWGDSDPTCDKAVMTETAGMFGCGKMRAWPVCSKPGGNASDGICDLIGNVNEWTLDWYEDDYYSYSAADNPRGPSKGLKRTLRGGSYLLGQKTQLRITTRWYGDPVAFEDVLMSFGFRCVYKP